MPKWLPSHQKAGNKSKKQPIPPNISWDCNSQFDLRIGKHPGSLQILCCCCCCRCRWSWWGGGGWRKKEEEEEYDDDDDDDDSDVDAKTKQHNLEDHCSGSLETSPNTSFSGPTQIVDRMRVIQDTETTRGKDHTHWLLQEAKLQKKHAVNGPSRFFFVAQLFSTIIFGIHFLISEVLMGVMYNIPVYIYRFVY